jgi:SAM-dependent methyltransferase
LAEVNHYLFAGRRDFALPFRALVAGGGTGDAAIMLAQQLSDEAGSGSAPGEVVYLDISEAAREIAEARAAARGLANLRFVTGSLEDLPGLGLGPFDYIDCCGVLHHLAEPAAGLRALVAVLAEGGGLGLMVYGALGRTSGSASPGGCSTTCPPPTGSAATLSSATTRGATPSLSTSCCTPATGPTGCRSWLGCWRGRAWCPSLSRRRCATARPAISPTPSC